MSETPAQRVTILGCETLADDWYVLRKYRFEFLRSDGSRQTLSREAYDRGNGAALLLFNRPLRGVDPLRRLRNFDVFDLALNHAVSS